MTSSVPQKPSASQYKLNIFVDSRLSESMACVHMAARKDNIPLTESLLSPGKNLPSLAVLNLPVFKCEAR